MIIRNQVLGVDAGLDALSQLLTPAVIGDILLFLALALLFVWFIGESLFKPQS